MVLIPNYNFIFTLGTVSPGFLLKISDNTATYRKAVYLVYSYMHLKYIYYTLYFTHFVRIFLGMKIIVL
jgi:hypothetical protein